MYLKKLMCLLFLFCVINTYGQNDFSYSPKNPKAGEVITISYVPAGDIADTKSSVEAGVYTTDGKSMIANDLILKKSGNQYTGSIDTDTATSFVYFTFSADNKFDNNADNGYWLQLYDNDKIKKGANYNLAMFYSGQWRGTGVVPDDEKALAALEKEFQLYPEEKQRLNILYLRLYADVNKAEGLQMYQKEIETAIKAGLKDEEDYSDLQSLYRMAKLPQQSAFIDSLKKEKFPNGKWTSNAMIQKFIAEKDYTKKEGMFNEIIANVKNDPEWKKIQPSLPFFKNLMIQPFISRKDWNGMKEAAKKYEIEGANLASLYNNAAWDMQGKDSNLKAAEDMSRWATSWAKKEWKSPTGEKPDYLTGQQWDRQRGSIYGMYADTYAVIQYKLGNYKMGLPYAKDAALLLGKGNDAELNTTYALLAEKALSSKEYVKQLENFVKDGKATEGIKEILKRAYLKNKGSVGFDDYLAVLEKESHLKMLEDLRKEILDVAVPQFTLVDLKGQKVNIQELNDKIVIVDFWATWCGPCKASFPGMQKMVTKYKNDPNVAFLFVDTRESGEDKEKGASEFIKANKYDFQVLMDNENKVVEQFKVSGIPTKFVIGKNGIIRFKSVGYEGSDDKLITKLSAMIDMTKTL